MQPKSYEEQEVIAEQLLRIKPDLTATQVSQIYTLMFGQAFTGTAFRRAQERLRGKPPSTPTAKREYVVALFTLFPSLTISTVRGKTRLFFKEDTREDIVKEWRELAQTNPISVEHAGWVVEEVQSQPVGAATFGLETQ